jgi:DNA-binding transcriptional regulator YiaG
MKPIKIEDITPEKLIEIEEAAENLRIHDMTMQSLQEISKLREEALSYYYDIELQCKIRAFRAINLGFSKAEIARTFNVTTNTITKWIG